MSKSKKGIKGFIPSDENAVHTGTEAWNIAQYFTGKHIALPLGDLDDLEDIARFGSVKIDDELDMGDDQYNKRRADAVKRYWQKLRQIVENTLFKVRKADREKANEMLDWLRKATKYFDLLLTFTSTTVDGGGELNLNEDLLTKLIDKLVEKKQEYLYILDRTGLIFREVDDVDLDKIANDFIHGG